MKYFAVYIMASARNGTLYVGMTSDLSRRVYEHKVGAIPGFTATYGVKTLVWYEPHDSADSAYYRERQIKTWKRGWKIALIEKTNPAWRDLYDSLA